MSTMPRSRAILFALLVVVTLLVAAGDTDAKKTRTQVPFEAARIIIEFNATAQDAGVQVFVDSDDPWKHVKIIDPKGRQIFDVAGKGQLRGLGLSELFFESDEPSLADQPLDEFLAKFPEGEYEFIGMPVENGQQERLFATATFTHAIPDGPVITSPAVQSPSATVISWNPVTTPAGIQIVGYEVIIEKDAFHVFDVKVPASVTTVAVPPQLLQPGMQYLFEVLAIEVGGNQTITESTFSTP